MKGISIMNKIKLRQLFVYMLIGCCIFIMACNNNSDAQNTQIDNSINNNTAAEAAHPSEGSYSKNKKKTKKSSSKSITKSKRKAKPKPKPQPKKPKSNNGTYTYETSDGYLTLTIRGNSWSSKFVIRTGFGEAYDNQNAQYDRGLVNGNDLYDSSGYVKIGSVSNGRVNYAGYNLYK